MYNDHCTTFELELYSESVERSFRLPITARIVQGLPYDFIVGLPTIRKYKLAKVFDFIFEEDDIMKSLGQKNYNAVHVVGQEKSEKTRKMRSAESTCPVGKRKQQEQMRRLALLEMLRYKHTLKKKRKKRRSSY